MQIESLVRPTPGRGIPLQRSDGWKAIALALLVLLLGSLRMTAGVCGAYHDDAIYVLNAKAMAEGQGYRLINLPGAPPQTKYPILYPSLLAAVWWLWPSFPENLVVMQVLSLLAGAGTVAAAYLYLVRFGYGSPGAAFAAGLVSATTPMLLFLSTATLAEMPFALLLVLALWALEAAAERQCSAWLWLFGLGVLLALPYLCRAVGVVIIPVGLLFLYFRGRPLSPVAAGSALVVLPWLAWVLAAAMKPNAAIGYYTDYRSFLVESGVAASLGSVFRSNVLIMTMSNPSLEGLYHATEIMMPLPRLVLFLAIGVVSWGCLAADFGKGRLLPCCLAVYALLLAVWPWPPHRFLVPVLPLLGVYFTHGMAALFRRSLSSPPLYRLVAITAVGTVTLANLALAADHMRVTRSTNYPYFSLPERPVSWASHEGVFAWIRSHTKPTDVVAAGLDSMLSLYTQRPAIRPFVSRPLPLYYDQSGLPVGDVDDLTHILKACRVRYLVQTPLPGYAEDEHFAQLLDKFRRAHTDWLIPVYEGDDQRFRIFEMHFPHEEALPRSPGANHGAAGAQAGPADRVTRHCP